MLSFSRRLYTIINVNLSIGFHIIINLKINFEKLQKTKLLHVIIHRGDDANINYSLLTANNNNNNKNNDHNFLLTL